MEEAGGRSPQPNTQFGLPEKLPLVAAAYLNEVRYASDMLLSKEPPRAATPGGFLLSLGYCAAPYPRTGARFPELSLCDSLPLKALHLRGIEESNPALATICPKNAGSLVIPHEVNTDLQSTRYITCEKSLHAAPPWIMEAA